MAAGLQDRGDARRRGHDSSGRSSPRINAYAAHFDFIQIPVLALATPLKALTHGVYCDEFAEYHTRDMAVRSRFGCFLPGAGVGTGYRRAALEALAEESGNRVFEPLGLTEDYETGLRLHRLGFRQVFVPLTRLRRRARLHGHARIFSEQLGYRAAPADTLGDGDRATRLGALRVARQHERNLLAVVRPEGVDRESARRSGQRGVPLRAGDGAVEALHAAWTRP